MHPIRRKMKKMILNNEEKDILDSYERGDGNLLRIQNEKLKNFRSMLEIHSRKIRG